MSATTIGESATALVREGWDHLKSQRPLAAWASWQRALRVDPDSVVARQALSTLESAADLPLAARTTYRFRQPSDPERRAAWNDRLRGSNAEDLAAMADLFGRLAAEGPPDPSAWYNRALCLAWSGDNLEAISALDHVVGLEAGSAFEQAVEAWTLAEVLRQGGGAESLADDLRFACTIAWKPTDTAGLLKEFPEIQRVPTPREPGAAPDQGPEIEVFEWLDRPAARLDHPPMRAADLPTVLASVYVSRQALRLSSPRWLSIEQIKEVLVPRLEEGERSLRREASPLPFAFLDADLWTFRIPPGVDPTLADQLRREAVESYFENEWIHRPRQGLGGVSPLSAARQAGQGDAVARAKLTAVVRLREQVGNRRSALLLYQGYPFDRLRRRLGLELDHTTTVDPIDVSCASPEELDRVDAKALDDARLVETIVSAVGLRDDARTARLAADLLSRPPRAVPRLDLASVASALVRQAIARNDHGAALGWIERAKPLGDDKTAKTLDVWRAEILARAGRPESALPVYLELITPDAKGAELALDAAETMLDNGHLDQAKPLLIMASDLARRQGRQWHWIERHAQEWLDRLS
jgi:tetratricopeptide (TPR) repeat protein